MAEQRRLFRSLPVEVAGSVFYRTSQLQPALQKFSRRVTGFYLHFRKLLIETAMAYTVVGPVSAKSSYVDLHGRRLFTSNLSKQSDLVSGEAS